MMDGGQEAMIMVRAYVLIQTEVGQAARVAKEVAEVDGVGSAESVTGPYDVIALVEAASIDDLGRMVVSRIQGVKGITRTLTCPVVHF
jgi:DNA-binding Lrp family transcriptional regulator